MLPQPGTQCRLGTDLIADSGYVDILLSVKGVVRDSADALLHVGSDLVHLELPEAGSGAAALHLVGLHPPHLPAAAPLCRLALEHCGLSAVCTLSCPHAKP